MQQAKKFIPVYLLLIPVFFAIDLVWLGFVAVDLYDDQIGFLLADQINWVAAIVFYLLYIAGIVYFAVAPGITKKSLRYCLISAAIFGFLAYATYDLTNLATIDGWPLQVTIIDLIWGTILTTTTAFAGWQIAKWLILSE